MVQHKHSCWSMGAKKMASLPSLVGENGAKDVSIKQWLTKDELSNLAST